MSSTFKCVNDPCPFVNHPDHDDYYWTDKLIRAQFEVRLVTMIPTVSRMIHVTDPATEDEGTCLAALVCSVDYGVRQPKPVMYLSIWSKYGSQRATVLEVNSPHWHDPKECPHLKEVDEFLAASNAALGVAANL